MISIENTSEPDSNWNKRLIGSKLGTIYQTREYGLYTNSTLGWQTEYLKFVNQKGEIVGQLMLSVYSRFAKKGNVGKILKKITGQKNKICRWVYGPIIFDSIYNDEICKSIRDFLILKNCRIIGYEHPLSSYTLSSIGKPFQIKQWGTFLINLSDKSEILWEKLDKHSARKNIERSQKRGVEIKEMNRSDLALYQQILSKTKKKVGSTVYLHELEILWNTLHPIGLTGFLAHKDEIPVGGIIISSFNRYVNEWGIARSEKDTIEKLYSQDLLKWKVIEWGIYNKFRYYDLTGTNPNSEDKKEIGIFRYKQKWGGELKNYNQITL